MKGVFRLLAQFEIIKNIISINTLEDKGLILYKCLIKTIKCFSLQLPFFTLSELLFYFITFNTEC